MCTFAVVETKHTALELFLTYLIIFISLALIEWGYLVVARRLKIVARATHRSSHRAPVVVGGGIVYYFAIMAFWLTTDGRFMSLMGAATLLAVISFIDDVRPQGVELRLLVQFLAVIIAYAGCHNAFQTPSWGVGLVILGGVGFLNGWNFMDGINGLCGAYTFLALLVLLYIDCTGIWFTDPGLLICGILASVVFGWCNFRRHPLCFAGDVGSMSAAIIVLFGLGQLMLATRSLIWLCFVAVYGVDVILTIAHRMMLRQNLFRPHRQHLYQLLANEGHMGHRTVTLIYVGVQGIIDLGLYVWPANPWLYFAGVIVLLSAAYCVGVARLFTPRG